MKVSIDKPRAFTPGWAAFACLALAAWAGLCPAETRYISDQLEITMRSGPSTQNRITRMLTSGTPLEVISADGGNGYAKVREPGGREGWVLSRFLSDQPGAQAQLLDARQDLAALQADKLRMTEQLKSVGALHGTIARLEAENQTLAKELETFRATAANILSLDRDAANLESAIDNLVRRNESLLREKLRLEDETAPKWFVRGAGVILLGIILGLVIPRLRGKSKRHWGEL